ncbi:hypothetical protein K458DRAFT_444796 [Lentithecium fluviatile CBS 122367]|uniref:Uncharacterized protein n=1 Tax=Lentithecium fluviatile CBS 122367 TaxID=1168545 RepID=A0A6G1ITK5_9PLEO|nr:hypothetical protein K458DRAFT_444796 [Lentithecium fluviatile CBS 122367]
MAYNVYHVEYRLGLQDPLMPAGERFHNVLFVETDPNGDGRIFHVTGAIADANGMRFEEKMGKRPEDSNTYHQKHYLGQIPAGQYEAFIQLMQSVPAPPRQRIFDPRAMRLVQCKPDGSLYQPGETVPPYMKCTEWVLERAIPALQQSGFLYPDGIPQEQPAAETQQTQEDMSEWTWDESRQKYYYYNYATQEYVWSD